MASPLSLGVIGEETSARRRKQGETFRQLRRENRFVRLHSQYAAWSLKSTRELENIDSSL
jgi:hypothetical protein